MAQLRAEVLQSRDQVPAISSRLVSRVSLHTVVSALQHIPVLQTQDNASAGCRIQSLLRDW